MPMGPCAHTCDHDEHDERRHEGSARDEKQQQQRSTLREVFAKAASAPLSFGWSFTWASMRPSPGTLVSNPPGSSVSVGRFRFGFGPI